MKITAAAVVALLALTSAAQADVIPIVQTVFFSQRGNDPATMVPGLTNLITFEPFDVTLGILTEATLRVTASYTPYFFNVLPVADTFTAASGVCLTDFQTFRVCATVPSYVGAPVTIDQIFDVTTAALKDEFVVSYNFSTTLPEGSAIDTTFYIGSAILTYYDPPLPVPEPGPLGIMALALLSVGLIRRKC